MFQDRSFCQDHTVLYLLAAHFVLPTFFTSVWNNCIHRGMSASVYLTIRLTFDNRTTIVINTHREIRNAKVTTDYPYTLD